MTEEKKSTLTEHLLELRRRVTRSAIVFIVTTTLSFLFTNKIIEVLRRPAPPDAHFIYTELPEMVGVFIKVGLMSGFVLALPYIIAEVVLFVTPGLRPKERRFVFAFIPSALCLFAGGVAFGYFVLLPPAMNVMFTFGTDIAEPMIRISSYIGLLTRLLFWLGIIFELPLVAFLLAKVGIIGPKTLDRFRRHAVVGAFILAGMITPTVDPINQALLSLPLIALYEASIWLAKLARRKPRQTPAPAG